MTGPYLTIPNVISGIRVLAVPFFLWLLFGADDPAAAGWLLGAIGATDWVDGFLARRLGQVSELGKLLDPLADRLAIASALVGGWISGALPWPIALALIARETIVAVGAMVMAARTGAQIEVRMLGKAATMALYISIANFFIYEGTGHAFFGAWAWGLVFPGLIAYYVVAGQYALDVMRALRAVGVSSDENPTREAR